MLLFGGGFGVLVATGLWLFCVVDAVTTPDDRVRNLPKLAWVFIIVLFFDLGALLWLVLGRPWGAARGRPAVRAGRSRWNPADAARPVRRVPTNPDDDEEFLAQLRRRAEEERRRREADGDAR
jgi:hypothetical protein